jgi:hypothetical protein
VIHLQPKVSHLFSFLTLGHCIKPTLMDKQYLDGLFSVYLRPWPFFSSSFAGRPIGEAALFLSTKVFSNSTDLKNNSVY